MAPPAVYLGFTAHDVELVWKLFRFRTARSTARAADDRAGALGDRLVIVDRVRLPRAADKSALGP
jgi:hypothetical protein